MKLIQLNQTQVTKEVPGLLQCRIEYEVETAKGRLEYAGPKFAPEMWHQVMSFFRWTHKEMRSESQVRLYVNPRLGRWGAWAFSQEARTGMSARELTVVETPEQARQRFASWQSEPSEGWGARRREAAARQIPFLYLVGRTDLCATISLQQLFPVGGYQVIPLSADPYRCPTDQRFHLVDRAVFKISSSASKILNPGIILAVHDQTMRIETAAPAATPTSSWPLSAPTVLSACCAGSSWQVINSVTTVVSITLVVAVTCACTHRRAGSPGIIVAACRLGQ